MLLFAFHGATYLTLRTTGELARRAAAAAGRLSIAAAVRRRRLPDLDRRRRGRPQRQGRLPAGPSGRARDRGARWLAVVCVRRARSGWAFVLTAAGAVARRRHALHEPLPARDGLEHRLRQQPHGRQRLLGALHARGDERRRADRDADHPALPGLDVPRLPRAGRRRRADSGPLRRRRRAPAARAPRPVRCARPRASLRRARAGAASLLAADAVLGVARGAARPRPGGAARPRRRALVRTARRSRAVAPTARAAGRRRLRRARRRRVGLRGRRPAGRRARPLPAPARARRAPAHRATRPRSTAPRAPSWRRSRSRESTRSRRRSRATCPRSCWRRSFRSPCSRWSASIDLTSARVMLLTLPLVPVFMWLIGRYTEQPHAGALAGALAARDPLRSTSFAGCRRSAPSTGAARRPSRSRVVERAVPARDDGDAARRIPLGLGARARGDARRRARRGHRRRAPRRRGPRPRGGADGARARARSSTSPLRNLAAQFHASADGLAVAGRLLDLIEAPPAVVAGRDAPPDLRTAPSGSSGCRSPTRAARCPCSIGSTSSSRRARRSRSSGRAAPARARSPRSCSAWPSRRADASPSDGRRRCRLRRRSRGGSQLAWVPQQPTLLRGDGRGEHPARRPRGRRRAGAGGGRARRRRRFVRDAAGRLRDASSATAAGRSRRAERSGSRWRARSCATRRSSSSTSRPRTSTRRARRSSPTAIERLRRGRTVLLIAHRPELAARADRVVRLEGGRSSSRSWRRSPDDRCCAACSRSPGPPRWRVAVSVALGTLTVALRRRR